MRVDPFGTQFAQDWGHRSCWGKGVVPRQPYRRSIIPWPTWRKQSSMATSLWRASFPDAKYSFSSVFFFRRWSAKMKSEMRRWQNIAEYLCTLVAWNHMKPPLYSKTFKYGMWIMWETRSCTMYVRVTPLVQPLEPRVWGIWAHSQLCFSIEFRKLSCSYNYFDSNASSWSDDHACSQCFGLENYGCLTQFRVWCGALICFASETEADMLLQIEDLCWFHNMLCWGHNAFPTHHFKFLLGSNWQLGRWHDSFALNTSSWQLNAFLWARFLVGAFGAAKCWRVQVLRTPGGLKEDVRIFREGPRRNMEIRPFDSVPPWCQP